MAKKNVIIEEPVQEEQVLPTFEETVVEEAATEATEPTVEPINWFENGWPSRDFFSPIPGVTDVHTDAAQDGGQE